MAGAAWPAACSRADARPRPSPATSPGARRARRAGGWWWATAMRWPMASACWRGWASACRSRKRTWSRSGRRWARTRGRGRWSWGCSRRRYDRGMSPTVLTAALLLLAYLLGSVSGSLLLGRLRGVDIRRHGSGNAGGTNAFRTLGWKFALGVAAVDIGKGALATWIALRQAPVGEALSVTAHGYLAAFVAVLGHVWPLWHGFRGGKGAATTVGGLLVLWPWSIALL